MDSQIATLLEDTQQPCAYPFHGIAPKIHNFHSLECLFTNDME